MHQTPAERRKMAYLKSLTKHGPLKAWSIKEGKMVEMHNPKLVEEDGVWRAEDKHHGYMLSRFVKPPPENLC